MLNTDKAYGNEVLRGSTDTMFSGLNTMRAMMANAHAEMTHKILMESLDDIR